ncbi:MAG TPA: hypothetical protein VK395_09535 [Gemmataceae bacterium]|nr:hypothetical protein [Gemmataceae bacterium]
MHKACAFLTAAFLAWATTPCHAGDNAQQSVLPAATTLSNGAAQEKLPQPTATSGTPALAGSPVLNHLTPVPEGPAAPGCCSSGCNHCQRFIEWLTYRPVKTCGPCGCLLCPAPCCDPPLYMFFLAECHQPGCGARTGCAPSGPVGKAIDCCANRHPFLEWVRGQSCEKNCCCPCVAAPAEAH